jgi:methyl-accepting chemotaxis protein
MNGSNHISSQWHFDLKRLGDELKETTKDSEEEFMFIGSRLQEFFSTTEGIAKMSSHITNFLSGSEIADTIDRLRQLMSQMNDYIKDAEIETSQRVEEMTYIINTINSLYKPIEDINSNIKRLNRFGFTTRIHSGTSDGSSILAEDIEKLSSEIVSKKTFILESLQSLSEIIEETLAKVLSMNEKQLNTAWAIVDNSMSSLTTLTEKRNQSTNIGKSISICSGKAFRSVEEIVKYLQFHDITYQKMAQMKDMLYDLHEMVKHSKCEESTHTSETIKHVSELGYMCEDRAEQISTFRDTLITAVNHIMENLGVVKSSIRNVSDDVLELTGKGTSENRSFFMEMENGLSSVTSAVSALSENAEHSMGLSKTISSFSEKLKEISAFIEDIERIEDDIELIALNASVKSANIGKGGEALSVIAESIRTLLADIREETAGISKSLRSIISSIEQLSARVTKESERDTEVYSRTEELKTGVDTLYHMNRDFASSLSSIGNESQKLSEAIEITVQGIRTHGIVSEACNRSIIELENISSHARALRSSKPEINAFPKRLIKDRPIEEGASSSEQVHFEGVPVHKHKDRPNEFGDNVELF